MKSLRSIRKEKGLTLIAVERQLGLSNVNLHEYEMGKHFPGLVIRKQLELLLGERINFLDTPRINTTPANPPCTWNQCQRVFRTFIKMIASLPEDDKQLFLETINKHLQRMINN